MSEADLDLVCREIAAFNAHDLQALDVRLSSGEPELRAALSLRRKVFCDEQGVDPEAEFDELDASALHVVAVTLGGSVVGTCRLFVDDGIWRLGRMAIQRELRGLGIGASIASVAERLAADRDASEIHLHAQTAAAPFYEKLGYTASGTPFDEEGIEHVKMTKALR
jgi:predicted GNAT family N-acyltransferase